jgi:hypothetical protein
MYLVPDSDCRQPVQGLLRRLPQFSPSVLSFTLPPSHFPFDCTRIAVTNCMVICLRVANWFVPADSQAAIVATHSTTFHALGAARNQHYQSIIACRPFLLGPARYLQCSNSTCCAPYSVPHAKALIFPAPRHSIWVPRQSISEWRSMCNWDTAIEQQYHQHRGDSLNDRPPNDNKRAGIHCWVLNKVQHCPTLPVSHI